MSNLAEKTQRNPPLMRATVAMLDGPNRRGILPGFSRNDLWILLCSTDDGGAVVGAAEPIDLDRVAYLAFEGEGDEAELSPSPAHLTSARVELFTGDRLQLRVRPKDAEDSVGFYGYPDDEGSCFWRYFVFTRAVAHVHLEEYEVDPSERNDRLSGVFIAAEATQVSGPPPLPNAPQPVADADAPPVESAGSASQPVGVHSGPGDTDGVLGIPDLIDVDEAASPSALDEFEPRKSGARQEATGATRMRSGDRFVMLGLITQEQLDEALAHQRTLPAPRPRIGDLLVQMGFVTEDGIYRALAQHYGVPYVDLDAVTVNPEAVESLERDFINQHHIFPFDVNETTLLVAICDPSNLNVYDLVRFRTNKQVAEAVVRPTQLAAYLERYLGIELGEEEAVADIVSQLEKATDISVQQSDEEDAQEVARETDSAVVKLVNRILMDAHQRGASDIHVEPGSAKDPTQVRFRIDGECVHYQDLPSSYRRAVVSRIKIMANLDIAERRKPQDGKIRLTVRGKPVELRVATLPTVNGNEDVVMRLLASSKPRPLAEMGMSERDLDQLTMLIRQPYGLVLCVGPTGSGKTTTLHSALGEINSVDKKIWTAEDPVEITQRGLRQMQVRPQIGLTFAAALRSFLRADPDVIMIGEMRDRETASIAVEASMTGHLVFSTLHTNSAPETVTRLLDMGIDPFNFADALLGVLAQRLARRLCSKCHVPREATEEEVKTMVRPFGSEHVFRQEAGLGESDAITLWHAPGCPACGMVGYRGRTALHELLVVDESIREAIQHRAEVTEVRRRAQTAGMTTLLCSGIVKSVRGETDLRQVLAVCSR